MNILIASDSFKGSLTSIEICEIATQAILKSIPDATITAVPMADGGEGSVDALVVNTGGDYHTCEVTGPFNQKVTATYGILGDHKTAVIEMSSASGIILANREDLNPLLSTSYGTGELILDAVRQGCTRILMGIGGSATNDGGLGMLQALGFDFLDLKGKPVGNCGKELSKINSISLSHVSQNILDLELLVACDVNNPLIGENGATYVYGPQKGGTSEMLVTLEKGLDDFGRLLEKTFSKTILSYPGAGAAGGMGAGLLGCLNSTLESGFKLISDAIHLESIVENGNFDYIFTGEGQINQQTTNGKLPSGIAKLGHKFNVPVIAVVGSIDVGYEDMYQQGLTSVFSIINKPMALDDAILGTKELLFQTYFNIVSLLHKKIS